MMNPKRCLLIALLLVLLCVASVQAQVLDNNPPGLRWQQLQTPRFQVLFPQGYEEQAQRTANVLEHIDSAVSTTLGEAPPRVSVILQNRTSVSNGFVTLAPQRSEFFTSGPQDYTLLGTNNWLDLLAVHEYRHVVQFAKSKTGFNKLIYLGGGEQGLAQVASWQVPSWFWEGDATVIETALTNSGRGRIPHFYRNFRATLLSKGIADYDQQYLLSFKHFYPSHYVLGYQYVSWLRQEYGAGIWSDITESTFNNPFRTFSTAINKHTGAHVNAQYMEMMRALRSQWQQEQEALQLTKATVLNQVRPGATYTEYLYPQPLPDGRVLALKNGLGDIDELVAIGPDGEETRLHQPGILNDGGLLSTSAGKVAWNEYEFHPRWRMVDYSVVKLFDLSTGKVKRLSKKSRYHGAGLSPKGDKVLTLEMPINEPPHYVILDAETGAVQQQIPNPLGAVYLSGRWAGDQILAIRHHNRTHAMVLIDPDSGAERVLYNAGAVNISHPVQWGDYVLYNSPESGIDQVYAISTNSQERYRITQRPYGAYNGMPGPEGKQLLFSDFTADGMNVARMPLNPASWTPIDWSPAVVAGTPEQLHEQEGVEDLLADVPAREYPVKPYNSLRSLLMPHSWGFWFDEDRERLQAGLFTQNLLSTGRITAGLEFDDTERQIFRYGKVSFQAWYPIIEFGTQAGRRQRVTLLDNQQLPFSFKERRADLSLSVPLILTNSKYLESFTLRNQLSSISNSDYQVPVDSVAFNDVRFVGNVLEASYVRLLKTSKRDIVSRFGQTLRLRYSDTPGDHVVEGGQFAADASLYFPGLARHHSWRLRLGYQREDVDEYSFGPAIRYPRGLQYLQFAELTGLSTEYTLPLWYPDLSIASLLNVQRLRGLVYYDYVRGDSAGASLNLQSLGLELTADFNLFRLQSLLSAGVRIGYLPEQQRSYAEVLLTSFAF